MGYADEPVPDPQHFLKKQQNITKPTVSNDCKTSLFFSP
jgi:hypothetical protein